MSKYYIDADLLSEQVNNAYLDGDSPLSYHASSDGDTLIGKFQVLDLIYDLRTDDVTEVKHGEWEGLASGYGYKCSICGAREKRSAVFNKTHMFCYKCGAKMDGGNGK